MSKSYMVSFVMDQKKTAVGIYKHKIPGVSRSKRLNYSPFQIQVAAS